MGGAGAGCGEVLRTPGLYTTIGIRPLDTKCSSQTFRHKERTGKPVATGTIHLSGWNSSAPHSQDWTPIGRIRPSVSTLAAYAEPQRLQTATIRLWSPMAITPLSKAGPASSTPSTKSCGGRLRKTLVCTRYTATEWLVQLDSCERPCLLRHNVWNRSVQANSIMLRGCNLQ